MVLFVMRYAVLWFLYDNNVLVRLGILQLNFPHRGQFQPTPKTHVPIGGGDGSGAGTAAIKVRSFSAAALRCGTRSSDNEVLISVGNGPEEYDNQATVTSIDDFGVGLTTHSAGDRLKRTKSENSLTSPNINVCNICLCSWLYL